MPFDDKILSRVLDKLARKRLRRETELSERRAKVYSAYPRIAEIDAELKTSAINLIKDSVRERRSGTEALKALNKHNEALRRERAELLNNAGYPDDYLTLKRDCPICGDSGFVPSGVCSCLVRAYADEQRAELSRLLPIRDQTFDSFSLEYYSTEIDKNWGMSPRDNMSAVFDTCREFAAYFGPDVQNLLLCGGTGLGKTFLSSAIAGELTTRGFSVIYDTAVNVLSLYEREKFSRDEDVIDAATEGIGRLYRCDLLILDDLGTEMMSPFVNTALYTLINTRLMNGGKMVINTNLSEETELPRRYSPQIVSRLRGEFLVLPFFGDDIRIKKNSW